MAWDKSNARDVKGKIYSPAMAKTSRKGNDYAVFSIISGEQIYIVYCFGYLADKALKDFKEYQEVIEVEVVGSVEANDSGDMTIRANSYKVLGDKKDDRPKPKEKHISQKSLDSYKNSMKARGMVYARGKDPKLKQYTKESLCVEAYGEWWLKLDFCYLMLGEEKVLELLGYNSNTPNKEVLATANSAGKASRFISSLDEIVTLAKADYDSKAKPVSNYSILKSEYRKHMEQDGVFSDT